MADLILPRGERKVLQAEDKDYKRGLLVKLLKDGGYSMAYWFNKPDKPYPVEVLVDGKSIKKDAKVVEMKFHPKDYYDKVQEAKTWSKKYKRSIDCNNPKGFSQKAHCAGRKKQESMMNLKSLIKQTIKEVLTENEKETKVGNYETKYFHMCPGAKGLFDGIEDKDVNMDIAERSAMLQDALFFIEKHILEDDETGSPEGYMLVANNLATNIMAMAKMMGLEKEHHYIQGHIDTIKKALSGEDTKSTADKLGESLNLFLEKNVPTNPSKWSYYKSQAKKKFDVYPSAYANAWAAKQYKKAGGSWKKG